MEGWKRLSFRQNSAFIDRSRSFCESHVAKNFNDEYDCYPMEVYCKEETEGKTYKVLILGKHFQKNEFKIFSACTFVKESKRPQPEFKKETFKASEGTECALNDEKNAKIKNAINTFFKEEKEDFQCVKFFENALDGGNVFLVKVDGIYVGVYEVGNEATVDCTLK